LTFRFVCYTTSIEHLDLISTTFASPMDEGAHKRKRLIAVAAATCVSLACGTNYAYSAWGPQFAQKLQLSNTESNLIVRNLSCLLLHMNLHMNLHMYSLSLSLSREQLEMSACMRPASRWATWLTGVVHT
jgi:hypothetical protein